MTKMNNIGTSKISQFYEGRDILVTGATGFIGKALLEKLLRSCSQISKIYLLMRPKDGSDVKSRLNDLLKGPVFDCIRKNNSQLLNKLVPMSGDITALDLGLSVSDQALLIDNVSVVFHSAATIKFDEELKQSVEMNLIGTKKLIKLCRQFKKLEALVHVSTAYCNCNEVTVQEKVYPPPAKPEMIIQCVESLDNEILNSITPQIIADRPNTYTFTKALAEQVLLESSDELPIAIVRPSIVTAAYREPLQGWIDNLNGPTGLLVGAAKGVLRTLYACRNMVADLVPLDIVINLLIVVAWHMSVTKPNKLTVYNCSSGVTNPIYWGDIEKLIHDCVLRHPCSEVVWYPGGSFKNSSFINRLSSAAFHTIPAYILDTLTRLSGKKPILVRVQKKMKRVTGCLEFFTTHEWKFVNRNMLNLYEQLNAIDKKLFNFNINEVNWTKYIEEYWLGVRKYVLKEDPNNIPDAYRHLRKFYWMHRISQLFMIVIFWRFLLKKSQTLQNIYSTVTFILQFTKLIPNFLLQAA